MTDALPKLIAFYLPQFHPIDENDAWWGRGFTEWNNVTRARPLFEGHHQPHRPTDLGYYDLRLPEVRAHQAALAQAAGLHGFCYYHYWFQGRRLLERPLQAVLDSGEPSLPFCVCWANENWTRRWDGRENEVLMAQFDSPENDRQFLRDLIPTLDDDRYIRLDDRPLLLVYRAGQLSDPRRSTDLWREEARQAGLGELHLAAVRHEDDDPVAMGFDAAVEFPPHGFRVPDIQHSVTRLDPEFRGAIYDYAAVADAAMQSPRPPWPLHRGVMLSWDNTARRGLTADIYHHATPQQLRRWLTAAIDDTRAHATGESAVFINAWNEWAEGTHLEPDEQTGHGWLEAVREAVSEQREAASVSKPIVSSAADPDPGMGRRIQSAHRRRQRSERLAALKIRAGNFMRRPDKLARVTSRAAGLGRRIRGAITPGGTVAPAMEPIWTRPAGGLSGQHPVLFVGHDAQLAGSQTLLKEMLRLAGEIPAIDSMLLLLGGGTLEPAYRRLATTCSLGSLVDGGLSAAEAIEACLDSIPNQPEAVVCNTVLSSQATQACRRRGLPVIQLINELPTTVHANGWDQHVIDIASAARRMVFVSDFSRRAFLADFSLDAQQCEVVHPGWLEHDRGQRDGDRSRRTIRRELGIPAESMIVLGCGHIHPRKGVDLFLQVARQVLASPDMQSAHFVWIGDGDHRDRQWIEHDRSLLEHQERIHLLGSRHEINRWFDGADLYLLSSREDPYPIVCVQSMAAGVPVLAFANAGGAAEAIHEGTGVVVPFLDTQAMSSAICDLLGDAAARTTMGQAARALAEARLSSHHHFSGILDIVASTCGVDVRAQR